MMQTIALSSGTLAYRHAGHGEPLLLIHGWGGSSRHWKATLERLADLRTLYAPDLPGYGDSPPQAGIYAPARLARLLMEFADELGIANFDLNGHSFSTSVVAYMAANWPERVRNLILTCPSTYRNDRERKLAQYMHTLTGVWVRLRQPWFLREAWLYQRLARTLFYLVPNDTIVRESIDDFLRMDKRTGIECARHAVTLDYNRVLRRLVVPTLVIGARQDAVMPSYGPPTVAGLVANSQLAWIENCGHLPMLERTQEYHHILRQFLHERDVLHRIQPRLTSNNMHHTT